MIRTPRGPAPKVKPLEQQQSDFTSEGAPPPGKTGTAAHAPADPAMPIAGAPSNRIMRGFARAPINVPVNSTPGLPHAADKAAGNTGAVVSKTMQQAHRDIARGLVDTDRGAEAGRTYRKLKH